jgi:hypothetical protein
MLGMIGGLIVTALFVWFMVRSLHGHDLRVYATPHAAVGIVLAALFWFTVVPLLALAWHGMLSGLGVHRSRRELFGIVGITQFAKYVPGNVGQYIGRVGMSLARGMPARALAATVILETLLVIAAAVVIGVGTGVLSAAGSQVVRQHGWQLGLVAALAILAAIGLFMFRLIAPRLLRRFAPKYAPTLDGALIPRQATLARAFVLYCCMYLLVGLGLVLLAGFLLPGASHDYWLLIAAFALAWVVGFVTPGAPAGLGVREGLLLLMLAPVYGSASAGILVIALRIATTLGDVLNLAIGWIVLPRDRTAPRTQPG